jgi:hypothetical protein
MCSINENNYEYVSITKSYHVAEFQSEGRIGPVDVQEKKLQVYTGGSGTSHST